MLSNVLFGYPLVLDLFGGSIQSKSGKTFQEQLLFSLKIIQKCYLFKLRSKCELLRTIFYFKEVMGHLSIYSAALRLMLKKVLLTFKFYFNVAMSIFTISTPSFKSNVKLSLFSDMKA